MATIVEKYVDDVKKAMEDLDVIKKTISPLISTASAEMVARVNDQGDLVLSDFIIKAIDVPELAKFINDNYIVKI